MGIIKRGVVWEWLYSWWMLFIFMFFVIISFFVFLFIGIKVRNRKWIMYGIIYFFIFVFGFILFDLSGVFIVFLLWVVIIIYGFKVCLLYLIQLDVYKDYVEVWVFVEVRSEVESRFYVLKQLI